MTYCEAKAQLARLARSHSDMLFRGQRSASWSLSSGLARTGWVRALRYEERLRLLDKVVEHFRELCVRREWYREEELKDPHRVLRLAQHHGLPTTLLDWTYSPYVALFFSFDGCGTTLVDDDVAVWCLDWRRFLDGAEALQRSREPDTRDARRQVLERYHASHDGVQLVRYADSINRRIHRQLGVFTEVRFEIFALNDYLAEQEASFPPDTLVKVVVTKLDQEEAIRDLALMGLDPAFLMADLDGVARSAYNDLIRFRSA